MKELALNILDIVQNAVRAGSSHVSISVRESDSDDRFELSICDNGPGIPADILDEVTDPFVTSRSTRKIGLGLSLLQLHAEMAGGQVTVQSTPGTGTIVKACFGKSHLDRQPLGDLAGTLEVLCRIDTVDFSFSYVTDSGRFDLSTAELKSYLGIVSLNDQPLVRQIGAMIRNNLEELSAEGYSAGRKS